MTKKTFDEVKEVEAELQNAFEKYSWFGGIATEYSEDDCDWYVSIRLSEHKPMSSFDWRGVKVKLIYTQKPSALDGSD